MKNKILSIALDLGWTDLGPQKSSHLISFARDNIRANFYETTGTLTLQDTTKTYDPGKTHKKVTIDEVKEILK